MKKQGSRSNWAHGRDTSLVATFLLFSATGGADANPDRVTNQLKLAETRANLRAERHELRSQRREARLENRALRIQPVVAPVPTASTTQLSTLPPIGSLNDRHLARTAVIYPGQVSTFRTERPGRQDGSTYINDRGRTRDISRGVSLDLSSTHANIVVGENLFDGNITIQVGEQTRTVSAGSRVTAAEYAALNQKLETGTQELTLNRSGAADGGSLNLNVMNDEGATIRASELVIPKNVSVSGDFARTADGVRVTKDVVNYGSLLVTSSNANRNTAVIAARDINNEHGGLIASQASASNPELNLALRADRDLNNLGTVTSAGDLELSAGRSVTNGAGSTATANGQVLLHAPEINNVGSIGSTNGNITLDAPIDSALKINNFGGILNAGNGAINIRNADYAGTFDTTVFGGNLYSTEVNINAGQGTADLTANEVTGMVNTKGLAAHVSTNTSDLLLGDQCLTGDPTYYNTGNIILGGNVIVAEKLAIIAGGNITTNQSSLTVRARGGANQGFDINIIAGANVVAGSGETPGPLPTQPPISGNTTANVSFSTNSATGGNIDFSTVTGGSIIDSSSAAAGQNAGNITMAAYAAADGTRGRVLLNNNWELNAGGNGASNNGSISVIAGSKVGAAIVVDDVRNFDGTGNTAGITIVNAQPTFSSGASITFDKTGSITTGNTIVPSSTIAAGTVSTGLMRSRGSVTVTSGGNAVVGQIQAGPGALVKIGSAGTLDIDAIGSLSAPNFTLKSQITAAGNLLMKGQIRTDGGILMVSGGDITSGPGGTAALFIEPDGNAGNIAVIAGANFTVNPTNVTITGASGTGGDVQFATNPIANFQASSNLNGNGGKIHLIAYDGIIALPAHPTPFSVRADSNGGTFTNGDITIIAGANVANAIVMGGAQATGSNNNTGDISILAQDPNTGVTLSTAANFAGVSAGDFKGGASNPLSGVNITRQVASNGGDIFFTAGSAGVQFADISRFGHFEVNSLGNITNHSPLDASINGAGDQPNTLLWMATGNISFSGKINLHSTGGTPPPIDGGGGVVMVAGGTVQSITNDLGGFSEANIDTSSGQDGGNITVVAGATFTKVGNNLQITGNSGSGGSIRFNGSAVGGFTGDQIDAVDSHSQGGVDQFHLAAGDINLISFNDILMTPGNTTTFSADSNSITIPPVVLGTNGDVLVVGRATMTLSNLRMTDDQGGSYTIRAATPGLATIDVTPGSLSGFGKVASGSFQSGALSNTVLNLPSIYNGAPGSTGFSIASGADITLGAIDVSSNTLGVGGGNVFIQSGAEVIVGAINASSTSASGNAGNITVISGSAQPLNVGGGGTNGTGLLTSNASATGDGGDVVIMNTGTGGILLTAIPSTTVTDGDGAGLILDAGTGTLDLSVLGSPTITRNAAGANNKGGTISLGYTGLTIPAGAITLSANGTGTGDGGSISVDNNGGGITVGAAAGNYVLSTTGTNGVIDLEASGAVLINGSLSSADFINIKGAGVTLNTAVTTNDIRVSSTGTITVAATVTADPITYIATGNIALNADQIADGGILIVSGGNITTTTTLDIDAHNDTGPAGNVVIIAGANFTETDTDVTINGASATGGFIDFDTGAGVLNQISAYSGAIGNKGGNVTLMAFQNSVGTGQIILTPAAPIDASGGNNADNGNIYLLAQLNSGLAVQAGNLGASTGSANSAEIVAASTTPTPITASPILKSDASYTGTFFDSSIVRNGNVTVGNILSSYGPVTVSSGGNVVVGTVTTTTGIAPTATGGDVSINSGLTSSLTVGNILSSGVGTGSGGKVTVTGGSGAFTLGTITANGGNTGAGGSGGLITISANSAAALNLNTIQANGQGSAGSGGTISVTNTGSGGLAIDAGDYSVTATGAGGSLSLNSGSGNITGGVLTLSADAGGAAFANGTITLAGNKVATTGNLTLTASGGTNGTGSIVVNSLAGVTTSGANFQATSGGSITAPQVVNTAGAANSGSITMNAFGNIGNATFGPDLLTNTTGGNKTGGAITVASTNGAVEFGVLNSSGSGTGNAGAVSISAGNGGIDFTSISADGNAATTVGLTSTSGDINASGGITSAKGALTINLLGATPGDATFSGISNVASITGTGTGAGTITFPAGGNAIVLTGLGSKQSFIGTTTNLATGVNVTGVLNTTGTLTFNTPRFETGFAITAASITAQSAGALTVQGAAGSPLLTGTTPPAGPPGSPSNPTAINFITGSGFNLNLFSNLTFTGDVSLNNPGGTTTSNAGSLFTGNNNIFFTTNNWVQTGNIVANQLIFAGTSIVNTAGAVTLGGPTVFKGRDLSIIALTNVNLVNFLIDTSSATGNGGNITILAGYNFTPNTGGQTTSSGLFTFSGTQTSSGSITGTAIIDASSTSATGNGGSLLAVANGGSISLGDIDVDSVNGKGGSVQLLATNSITAGTIDTTGSLAGGSGTVTVSASTPVVITPGTLVIQAGKLTGGSFTAGATLNNAAVTVGNIDSGNSTLLSLETAGTLNVTGFLIGRQISLKSGLLNITGPTNITANTGPGGQGGTISIDATAITAPATLDLNANGIVSGFGGTINVNLASDIVVGAGGTLIASATAPGQGGKVILSSDGNLTTLAGGINATGANGDGAEISLTAGADGTGTLILTDFSYLAQANATGSGSDGGKIVLDSQLMTFNSSSGTPLILSANGNGVGNGGSITFRNSDPTATFISQPAKAPKPPVNFLSISAKGGGAGSSDGGTIIVEVGGNLTVDPAKAVIGPPGANGNGGNYTFSAKNVTGKTGSLVILGNLDANGLGAGTDGTITLSSDNKKAFTIGGTKTPKNGILGTLSAGVVTINNLQGGVTVNDSVSLNSAGVVLTAGAKGAIATAKGATIKATSLLDMTTQAGSIGKKPLLVEAPILNLRALAGGSVNVTNTIATGTVTLNQATASGDFTLSTSTQGLNVDQVTALDGTVTLTAGGGVLNVAASADINATNGGIIISNSNLTTGSILVGDDALITTGGKGNNVVLAIGAPPKKGSGPNSLAGFTVTPTGKGLAFFGPNTADIISGGTVNLFATNKNVIFNNLSEGGQTIFVGDGSVITADPPSRITSSSVPFNFIELAGADSEALPVVNPQMPTIKFDPSIIGMGNANRIDSAAIASGITLSSVSSNTNSVIGTSTVSTEDGVFSEALLSSNSTSLLDVASISVTTGCTTDDDAISANGTSSLHVNAAFHSDKEAVKQALSSDEQANVKLSSPGSQSTERHVLSEGNVVFAPFSDMVVETPHGTVSLAAGAVALVMQSQSGLAVYDLHDSSRNAVVVTTKNKRISLSPGRHVLVSSHNAHNFANVNPIELVQYRGISQSKLENGWNVYTSEFAIPSACYAVTPLSTLMKSKHPEARGLAKRIMKTTAVLMTLSPDRGDFVQFFKQQMTAMH